jgi:hypothetical protein
VSQTPQIDDAIGMCCRGLLPGWPATLLLEPEAFIALLELELLQKLPLV